MPMKRRSELSIKDMTVTTVAFPPELHERLRRAAFEKRVAIAQIIRAACEAWLDQQGKKPKR